MKKTGLIINPNAKKIRTGRKMIDSYMKFKSDNIFINIFEDSENLKEIIKLYKKEKVDYICIAGGDGTIHLVLSELLNTYRINEVPPILILKGGTMDNIAHSVKLKGKGFALFKKFISRLNENKPINTTERFTMKIQDKYCFLFGTGFITNFLKKVYSGKEKGLYRNIQVAFMGIREVFINIKRCEIFSLKEQAIFIDEKKVLINPVSGILAGTVEYIGMSFSPLIEAVQQDGRFQILVIGMTPRVILRFLNKLRTGKKIQNPRYHNTFGKTMLLKQKGIFDYTMDGEIYSAENELKIALGPAVKFVKM